MDITNDDVLVKVEGVSKKFCKNLKTSLKYGVRDIAADIFGRTPVGEVGLRKDEFWAVSDINFELRRGECLGLIGHNGAGKSTLLKMLNGLIKPDKGTITMKGRIGALIELGAGFNPILTGRENIYINAQILGFTKEETDTKFDEIVAFAEIGEYLDMPVQNYSSGMKVRLGFAVAAQMEPDVLIIDEVLAVGDVGFKIKCLNRIGELLKSTAVIFVSHTMPQIARICTACALLEKGIMKDYSINVSEVIAMYYSYFGNGKGVIVGADNLELLNFNVKHNNKNFNKDLVIEQGDSISIEAYFKLSKNHKFLKGKILFINTDTRIVLDIASELVDFKFEVIGNESGFKADIPSIFLNAGTYTLSIVIQDYETDERIFRQDGVFSIVIKSKYVSWGDVVSCATWSKY